MMLMNATEYLETVEQVKQPAMDLSRDKNAEKMN